ncbi:MAG: shikimate kinase [Thermoleophilia bacterium]
MIDRWIVLTGYMGAGKSTVGRALAKRLGCEFIDSDEAIVAEHGIDIPAMFATKGELWFRRNEERLIRTLLTEHEPGVLAVGGGAVESARTRDLFSRRGNTAWLQAPPEVLWQRVEAETGRPLATDRDRFIRRYDKRVPAYEEAGAMVVDATQPVDDVVDALHAWAVSGAQG